MDADTINAERHSIEIATDILSIWGRWPYYRLATADGQMLAWGWVLWLGGRETWERGAGGVARQR